MGMHGKELRGLQHVARSSVETGRFGRMFRSLGPAFQDGDEMSARKAVLALAETMIQGEFADRRAKNEKLDSPIDELEAGDENPTIEAGYTYLGQFIDHDITFDPVSLLDALNDPDGLEDFRTPRLDLDSVYAGGPDDQPYLYSKDALKTLVLGDDRAPGSLKKPRPDLPRSKQDVALIGDPRNDENTIVGQLHSLFLRLHNKVITEVETSGTPLTRFQNAQQTVRWHYQWIALSEFLPRIVGAEMAKAVREGDHGKPDLRFYRPRSKHPYMPVEFSVAAYRYGHSMVRPSYSLSETVIGSSDADFNRVPIFSAKSDQFANLNGFRPLPPQWGIDWSFFFDGLRSSKPKGLEIPQRSYRIDTTLVDPLAQLPAIPKGEQRSLGHRNLLRGISLRLPSGQDVARAMGEKPLTDAVLFDGKERQEVLKANPILAGHAPLWFYILKEAELTKRKGVVDKDGGGHHLGPVGGRIVAEVLVGLVWHDHHSYLFCEPNWQPTLGKTKGKFSMSDLVTFVDG